jgi:uncharacterized protein with PQ loop repeat
MDIQTTQLEQIAGGLSTLLFVTAYMPMLWKAYKTKNMRSYSLSNMLLTNVGNLLYWLYVGQMPLGPIWLLHTFYTVTSAWMLVWYVRHTGLRRTTA